MFKHVANQALLQNISAYCMVIEFENRWISAVVIADTFAASALHSVPDCFRENGTSVILRDDQGELHNAHIHGSNAISDYIVFKKDAGSFKNVPKVMSPQLIDKYIVIGCAFGEKTVSVRVGHISSISTGSRGFFYGDSGGIPGFSGGGAFCSRNGFLMGIARGNEYDGNETHLYGNVLEMISAPLILNNIEVFGHQPFSV
ncbi:unnamed protein product [Caenorhabditis auriculariae]|uniref:Uncharacterized protein n=2 Tax=Caenorhabditis auriculariae TaxID=2777116 RepID=A0A8S1HK76_9PELO|nr:unnamed protein product [Caenorhabditis auriculariae]